MHADSQSSECAQLGLCTVGNLRLCIASEQQEMVRQFQKKPGNYMRANCPTFSLGEGCFDFAETRIDFVGQFVRVLIFGFELGVFRLRRFDRRRLLGGKVSRRAVELPQAVRMAVRKSTFNSTHFQPQAAIFSASAFSFAAAKLSSKVTFSSQPPSSSSKRSRMTMPPACS